VGTELGRKPVTSELVGNAMISGPKKQSMCMQIIALCALGFCVGHTLYAEDAGRTAVEDLVKHWQISKDLSLAVAKAMPEGNYSFKPPNAEFGFADQMGNIALVNVLSCTMALGTRAPERFQSAFDRPMDLTKTGVMKSLTVAYDYCIDGLKQMNDADLLKMAVFAGHSEPKFDILWEAYAHATHGLGEVEIY
jgi:hypothetical protein